MVINAPNVIGSLTVSTIADFPTNLLLPFRAQIIISLGATLNFSGISLETLTISHKSSLPFFIFEDRNTMVPCEDTSDGEYVNPMYDWVILQIRVQHQL